MKYCILLFVMGTLLVSVSGLTDERFGDLTISGGRPLHQAEDINSKLQDLNLKYAYVRCVHFQSSRLDGDKYSLSVENFPNNIHDLLEQAKSNLATLEDYKKYLYKHHRDTFNANITWEYQKILNSFRKDFDVFMVEFNELFEMVSKRKANSSVTRLCSRVLES
jgi:hypothetical protein